MPTISGPNSSGGLDDDQVAFELSVKESRMSGSNLEAGARVADAARAAWAAGRTYADYADNLKIHQATFGAEYQAVSFTDEERRALAGIPQPVRVLAVVEEKCPDVIANLPIVAQIVEAIPGSQLRILHRPDHRDVADAYPATDGRNHIPTYVVFTENGRELGVFIERPDEIQEEYAKSRAKNYAKIDEQFPNTALEDLPEAFTTQLALEAMARRRALRDTERAALVRWFVRIVER